MEDYQYNAVSHHHSTNTPIDTGCIPVPLKCGLCEYSTTDVSDLVEHTSTHTLQRHPFKCTRCMETFPGYTELQQHPCGDAQFMFLLSTPQTDNNTDISNIPEGEVVDLSAASRKRNQNMNIVYGPASPKRCKSNDGEDEASVTDEKNVTLTSGNPMTLRARLTPHKYTDSMKDDQPEEDMQNKQPSGKSQHRKISGRPMGKDYKYRGKSTLMSCKYCNFETGYPGNLKSHVELHQQPGRQHYACQVCELKFLTPKQQKTHNCGFKKLKIPKLKPGITKLKTPKLKPEMSTMETLKPKPDKTNLKTPKFKSEMFKMKTPTQVPDMSKKLGTFNASLASAGKATPEYVYVCRLCNFMSIAKCNVTQHVYRHRCVYCHDYFPTVTKRSNHMSKCKKPIVTYSSGEQQISNMWGETLMYRHAAPRTLFSLVCFTCKGRFQHPAEYQVHKCTTKKPTKAASSQSIAGGKTPQSKSDTPKKASQTKGKAPISPSIGTGTARGSNSSSKKPRGKMEGYDDKLQMYTCKFCVFTNPTPLAVINHLKSHNGTETPLEKTPALQAQRLEFAREKERERTKPRMEGWDDEAMLYVCDVCSFATSTPIVLYNHKKYHKVSEDDQKVYAELQGEDQEVREEDLEEEEPVDVSVDDEDDEEEDIVKDSNRQECKSSKWLMCGVCDFTTRRRWNLQAHTGLHTGTRPFKCHTCNIGFTDHYYLKIHHMKLHGKEDRDSELEPVIKTCPQPSKTESCPQLGCSFKSNSTTEFTQHFRNHLQSMSTNTSNNHPALSYTPEKTHKLPRHPDLSNTTDKTNQLPPHSAGKTMGVSNAYQNITPNTATAKRLTFTDPCDDRLSITNSPEVIGTPLRVNSESPELGTAELPDKASCGTTPHKDAVTSSLGMRHKESVVASPSWMQNAVAVFKVLQPVKSYLSGPSGNSVVDTAASAPTVTSDVGAEPQPQTERGSDHRCSSEHLGMSYPECSSRSVCTPTGQTTTEEIIKGDEMPVLQQEGSAGTDVVNADVGKSTQGLDTKDKDNRSTCTAADVTPLYPLSPCRLQRYVGSGCTREEMRGVWRPCGLWRPLQTKSCMQLFPESTAATPNTSAFLTSATDSAAADIDVRADVTLSIIDNSPNATRPSMYNTSNVEQPIIGTSADGHIAIPPISPDSHIANPIPLYGSAASTVTSDTDRRADNSTQSIIDSSPITTCPIIDMSPDGHIATQPIIYNSPADAHPIIDTSPDGSIATQRIINNSPADAHPIIETSPDGCIATRRVVSHHPSGQTSAARVGGLGVGSRSLGSLHRCGFCAIYFEDLRLFLHHMGRHHPDHPWTCTGCWKNFRNVIGFIDHH